MQRVCAFPDGLPSLYAANDPATPPADLEAMDIVDVLPSLEQRWATLLRIDSQFIATHARTIHEASLLLEIGLLGTQMDLIMVKWLDILNSQEILAGTLEIVEIAAVPLRSGPFPTVARRDLASAVPTLQASKCRCDKRLKLVERMVENLMARLKMARTQLTQFIDINKASVQELEEGKLFDLAARRSKLADMELKIRGNIDELIGN